MSPHNVVDPSGSHRQQATELQRPTGSIRQWLTIAIITASAIVAGAIFSTVILVIGLHQPRDIRQDRYDVIVESVTLRDQPWFTQGMPCWNGSTVTIVIRLKNQHLVTPTDDVVHLKLANDTFQHYPSVVQVYDLPGSAIPGPGRTVDVPFTVELPDGLGDEPIFWNVAVTGDGPVPLSGNGLYVGFKPCGYMWPGGGTP